MNNRKIYVIYTSARTGSHIILESISGIKNTIGGLCNAQCYWYPNNPIAFNKYKKTDNIAIHTHNLENCIRDLHLLPKDVTLILSYRRDLFAQAMSVFVAQISNEWNGKEYSPKTITAQNVKKEDFLGVVNHYKNWPGHIDKINEYKSVIFIYYEDLVEQGPSYLSEKLGIIFDSKKLGQVQKKSTHHYKDCILNWKELHQAYIAMFNDSPETWPSWSKAPSC